MDFFNNSVSLPNGIWSSRTQTLQSLSDDQLYAIREQSRASLHNPSPQSYSKVTINGREYSITYHPQDDLFAVERINGCQGRFVQWLYNMAGHPRGQITWQLTYQLNSPNSQRNYRVAGAALLPGGVSVSANNRPTVSEGKIAPPLPPKPTAVAMPKFGKAAEILSVGLKSKIIKDLNLDNWMGLGGEITPLVMIDFYKKQNIDLIIHAHIKKEAIKTDSIKNNSINLINVGDHYMVLTVNKRGSIELIDVPGDGDCLFRAAVKGQQIATTPTVSYSYQQTGNHNDEHIILKELIKTHFQNNFDTFINDIKMILTTEKSKVANNILHDINTYIKLINL
ncbi:hypothetical protein HAY47_004189 [Salmonella enterica]|uniref:OTU domain-containing protein n=1 Tax=Salmonella enterica TaxID=28901 RepID=A0A4Q1J7X9_SALER|nr:OTU domain-containing protein [Salmonella enterica]ECF6040540.1 hypothetical protein [Salmonella enterica subsp. salamae]HCM1852897.1 hypothetical protein [Salmonella enterica subsp. salamae serovar 42:z29:-]AZT25119.1 hypothetical protein ELZ76_14830 [Salmonella enterica subsp. salamae serovar 42:r:-]AZT51350.1 hypothetical protein EL003_14800 [Salmonella enterica subsp. salamae serovar 42:r:-]AZT55776.1 hypothetical protein EL009_14845 [Salmonella enterica subsp. salamae serovar 42:r:-]